MTEAGWPWWIARLGACKYRQDFAHASLFGAAPRRPKRVWACAREEVGGNDPNQCMPTSAGSCGRYDITAFDPSACLGSGRPGANGQRNMLRRCEQERRIFAASLCSLSAGRSEGKGRYASASGALWWVGVAPRICTLTPEATPTQLLRRGSSRTTPKACFAACASSILQFLFLCCLLSAACRSCIFALRSHTAATTTTTLHRHHRHSHPD